MRRNTWGLVFLFLGTLLPARAESGYPVRVCTAPESGRLWLTGIFSTDLALVSVNRARSEATLFLSGPVPDNLGVKLFAIFVDENGAAKLLSQISGDTTRLQLPPGLSRFSIVLAAESSMVSRPIGLVSSECPADSKMVVATSIDPSRAAADDQYAWNQQMERQQGHSENAASIRAALLKKADEQELLDESKNRNQSGTSASASPPPAAPSAAKSGESKDAKEKTKSADKSFKRKPKPETAKVTSPSPKPDVVIDRYPVVRAPSQAVLNQPSRVKVQLTEDAPSALPEIVDDSASTAKKTPRGSLKIFLAAGRQWPITVTITAPDFEIKGEAKATFTLKDNDDSGYAEFDLVAQQLPPAGTLDYFAVQNHGVCHAQVRL